MPFLVKMIRRLAQRYDYDYVKYNKDYIMLLKLPIFRGIKISEDDKIRRHLMNDIRTFFNIRFKEIHQLLS